MTNYEENINRPFFESMGVRIQQYQPWQFALSHPDVPGRFMWYPRGGALMHEHPLLGTGKVGDFTDSEQVYEEMVKKIPT